MEAMDTLLGTQRELSNSLSFTGALIDVAGDDPFYTDPGDPPNVGWPTPERGDGIGSPSEGPDCAGFAARAVAGPERPTFALRFTSRNYRRMR